MISWEAQERGATAPRSVVSVVADRAVDETVLVREPRYLGAVRHAELPIDVRQVELDGLFRHPELLADRLVREAAREGGEDRRLALGEAGRLGGALAGLR